MFHEMKRKKSEISEDKFVPKAFRKNKINNSKEKNSNSKKANKNKINEDNKSNKIVKKHKFKKLFFIILLCIFILMGIYLGISSHTWKSLAKEMIANQNSIIIDSDSNTIAKLGSERKIKQVSSSDMGENLKNAYVAIEDERFYSHFGIDIKRTSSAILSYVFNFGSSSYGGSTITQQLVKNLTGDSTDSVLRKIKEWWKAWQLETCLTKNEILEGYLNIIYVGPNMYGVETAAEYYFSKSCKDLTLEECAFLAGINNSPNSYNPFTDIDNNEKIIKRTKIVISKMLELKYIDETSYNNAITNIEKGLKFKKGTINSEEPIYSYHTDSLILEITQDISEKYNISKTFSTNYINMSGLTIYSNQDSKVQKEVETEFEKSKYILKSKNSNTNSQAAMVIIDQKTGYVVGCTGGLGKKTTVRSLNRATQSIRQTGSAIKPLSVLAPAIDKKIITAATIVDDTERDFKRRLSSYRL